MKLTAGFRLFYTPVQPTVQQEEKDVLYREFAPDSLLQDFIYCYWQLKTTRPCTLPFNYRVVADGCMDVFFEPDYPQNNFVMGFCNQYTEFLLDHPFNYMGIRFLPGVFPLLYRINASTLSNRSEHLSGVAPHLSLFIENNVNPLFSRAAMKTILDSYFLRLFSNTDMNPDPRFLNAMETIVRHAGSLAIESGLDTGVSTRQLRRLFGLYIGGTAKSFSKIIRFQHVVKAQSFLSGFHDDKIFFDAGYYDQAHFIKEFKNLYGATPGQAFAR